MSRHPTRNDLPARTRARIEKLLNERLAEALDLSAAAKQAHWNARGAHFIALHELFDKLHGAVEEHVDAMAERISALGWSTWQRCPSAWRPLVRRCASRSARPVTWTTRAPPTC